MAALRVLFLSRRNTARGLMAEAIMNQSGGAAFAALSAGVEPAGAADPLALQALENARYETAGLAPRLVDDALRSGAEPLDFVFTLSDTARGEAPPEWPGSPITAHWSCTDPVLGEVDELGREVLYGQVLAGLERRIKLFMQLPFAALDRASLKRRVDEIALHPGG